VSLRVLITRAAEDAHTLADPLREHGLVPVIVPLVSRVHRVQDVARAAARGHEGWVLTSAAVVPALARVDVRPRWIAAVGPATARAARAAGLTVDLVPETATAAELARALGDRTGQRALYPRAQVASPGTLQALRATGAEIEDVVAYVNEEPAGAAEALAAVWPVDIVTLLSGSAARRLAAHMPPPWASSPRVEVIGPRTERSARRAGIQVHAVASPHTVSALIRNILQYCTDNT